MESSLWKRVLSAFALTFLLLMILGWVLLNFFFLDWPLYLWNTGEAPSLSYLLPPSLLLALIAGMLVWVCGSLERMRSAYSAITAQLQTKIDRLEAEVEALKGASSPRAESIHED